MPALQAPWPQEGHPELCACPDVTSDRLEPPGPFPAKVREGHRCARAPLRTARAGGPRSPPALSGGSNAGARGEASKQNVVEPQGGGLWRHLVQPWPCSGVLSWRRVPELQQQSVTAQGPP